MRKNNTKKNLPIPIFQPQAYCYYCFSEAMLAERWNLNYSCRLFCRLCFYLLRSGVMWLLVIISTSHSIKCRSGVTLMCPLVIYLVAGITSALQLVLGVAVHPTQRKNLPISGFQPNYSWQK